MNMETLLFSDGGVKMAKTLIIKSADFSANKVTSVVLSNPIPCTNITLSKSSVSIGISGSETITATVTPSDTTDSTTWASSNTGIVTVSSGVISAVGIGSATVTANCGSKSATVSVTVSGNASFNSHTGMYMNAGADYVALVGGSQWSVFGVDTDGSGMHCSWNDTATKAIGEKFEPISIPSGTAGIKITANGSNKISFVSNTVSSPTAGSAFCKLISQESENSSTSRTVSIPDGANALYLSVKSTNVSGTVIEFV